MSTVQCENLPSRLEDLKISSDVGLSAIIAKEIVSEILETAMDMATKPPAGDIFDTKDEEIPEKIEEKKEKSEEKIKKGLGDQLECKMELLTRPTPSKRHPPVEKKHRLTDLVRNSKQILSKYILQESKTDLTVEKEEKLISVTDLDEEVASCSKISPEDIPLPRNDSEEIMKIPEECSLEEINLPKPESDENHKKTMTFPMASGKSGFMQKCRTLRMHSNEMKKKKWSLGSKLAQFLKKGHKKEKKVQVDEAGEKERDEIEEKSE